MLYDDKVFMWWCVPYIVLGNIANITVQAAWLTWCPAAVWCKTSWTSGKLGADNCVAAGCTVAENHMVRVGLILKHCVQISTCLGVLAMLLHRVYQPYMPIPIQPYYTGLTSI